MFFVIFKSRSNNKQLGEGGGGMKVVPVSEFHLDVRRDLAAYSKVGNFAEINIISARAGSRLGDHSHPYKETFLLTGGICKFVVWTEKGGLEEGALEAPALFVIEEGEEHVFECLGDVTLVTLSPVPFEKSNITPATHVSSSFAPS